MAGLHKWGIEFPEGATELDVHMWRYAHDKRPPEKGGPSGEEERWLEFKHVVDLLWNHPDSTRRVIWNAWTERMLRAMITHRYTCLAGCGSSGKSDAMAVAALVEWLSAPSETLVLITSTTKDGARKRVWKSVTELWNSLEADWERKGKLLPGKMVASRALLKGMDINGNYSEALGLCIVAADTSSDQEASKYLKGLKAPAEGRGRLRLYADEMTDLGDSVRVAGLGNLNTNPDFKMVCAGNPRLKMDSFGLIAAPRNGWRSVSLDDDEWENDVGITLRFNASESPRIIEDDGNDKYGWFPSQQSIDQMKLKFGADSAEYWSQVLGMWPPDGLDNTIWSEGELLKSAATDCNFDGPTIMVSGLDMPYNSGGDRAVYIWGECGKSEGVKKLRIHGYKVLTEGLTEEKLAEINKGSTDQVTANLHMIRQYIALNKQYGIRPRYTGYDSTGGGVVFGQWVEREWEPGAQAVNFGGKPVERRYGFDGDEERFGNRVAQLWCQPKSFVRELQIVNLPPELCKELCTRKYADKSPGGRVYIETKTDLKKRIGESPDLSDAFVILVEVALLNGLLSDEETASVEKRVFENWRKIITKGRTKSDKKGWANPTPKKLMRK